MPLWLKCKLHTVENIIADTLDLHRDQFFKGSKSIEIFFSIFIIIFFIYTMQLILDGNSEIGGHVRSN